MKKVFLSALAIGALVFTSCKSDEPAGGNSWNQDGEGIGYMSFTIASSDQTRSTEFTDENGQIFSNGDENEYAICPNNTANVAFFFDSDGTFYGMSNLQAFNISGSDSGTNGDPDRDYDHQYSDDASHTTPDVSGNTYGDTEQYYTYITRWRNSDAKATPTQVLVVLNGNPEELQAWAESKIKVNELVEKVCPVYDGETGASKNFGVYKYDGENYFTMTNSVYWNEENKLQTATQIKEGQVCATAEEALKNPVTVFVERLLAKFELLFGENGKLGTFTKDNLNKVIILDPFNDDTQVEGTPKINYVKEYTGTETNIDYPDYETKEWKAYIVSWGINGLENNARYIKDIVSSKKDYFPGYNNYFYHRSYWAESPDYQASGEGFTTQYRYAGYDPNPDSRYYGNEAYDIEDQTQQLNTLHYLSFNDIRTRAQYKFTAERTYNAEEGLKGYGPLRYASHYLIGAQLLIQDVDYDKAEVTSATGMLDGVQDKYYAYNFYFGNKESYIRYAYRRMATQIADGREHVMNVEGLLPDVKLKGVSDGYLYYKDGEKYARIAVDMATDFFTTESAQVIHGDGKVVLKKVDGQDIYFRTGTGETDDNFTKLSAKQLLNIIYTYSEPARHFNKGAMYYYVPVQHNFGKTTADRVTIDKDNGQYGLGQFGVVRNHWYKLTVKTIGSVGIPVDDPDQPIIPDPEDDYYVALEIVVLPWHVINNGEVDL